MKTKHENVMHVVADALLRHFDASGAVNYIEQAFEHLDDGREFVLTMQIKNGITPCEKLKDANELIAKQSEQIKMLREALLLSVPYLNFNSMEESKAEQALSATEQE